jgi:CMP/dCMP kinase
MIVAIDGPAGAGKSVLARQLAAALDFGFLDTGAMYRAATLACLRSGIDLQSPAAVEDCVLHSTIQFEANVILLDGDDVSSEIRTPEVSRSIKTIADNEIVRQRMVDLQRSIVGDNDYVTEGRDQATIAFPNADCKIYLTASPMERATRRQIQMASAGIEISVEEILADQQQRDAEDCERQHGALRVADDAVYVLTDGMTESEVLNKLIEVVDRCRFDSPQTLAK